MGIQIWNECREDIGDCVEWTPTGWLQAKDPGELRYDGEATLRRRHDYPWVGNLVWPDYTHPIIGYPEGHEADARKLEHEMQVIDRCEPRLLETPVNPMRHAMTWLAPYLLIDEDYYVETLCGLRCMRLPSSEFPNAAQIFTWGTMAMISDKCPLTIDILGEIGYDVYPVHYENILSHMARPA
jgi:hypothetical protein